MSSDLLLSSQSLSMTSREIAELTGRRHDNVLRTVRALSESRVIRTPQIEVLDEISNLGLPIQREVFVFSGPEGKRDSIVVVAQLSPEVTGRLVDRWQELEARQPLALPQDYASALRALADAVEAQAAAERDNALLNTIIDNEFGYCTILRAARHLNVHESTFKWQPLKKATLRAGLEIKCVPSPRFEYQNLYPIKMFEQCYPAFDFSGLQPEKVSSRAVKSLGRLATTIH